MSLKLILVGDGLQKSVVVPTIIFPGLDSTENNELTMSFISSPFSSDGNDLAHVSSDWELSKSPHFDVLAASSYEDTVNKTSWTPPVLDHYTMYYVRVRYRDSRLGLGEWSNPKSFKTKAVALEKPSITYPTQGQAKVPTSLTLTSSAFRTLDNPAVVLKSSQWEFYSSADMSTLLRQVESAGTNNCVIAGLTRGQVYFVRVRHIGTSGTVSDWSDLLNFSVTSEIVFSQLQKITLDDAQLHDWFGTSVALSGDKSLLVVGAPGRGDAGHDTGSVYTYVNSNGTWVQQSRTVASDPASNDQFGNSVALSGDGQVMLVGSWKDDDRGSESGSVYFFTRSGNSWVYQSKLTGADTSSNDGFGSSVSLTSDGQAALVGSYFDNGRGSVYFFTRSGLTWSQKARFVASDGASQDQFGIGVAISGDGQTALVGANYDDDGFNNSGSVYVFTRSGNTWTQQAKLTAGDRAASDLFGTSVALSYDGSVALIGSEADDDKANDSGSVYIFTRSGSTWTQRRKLTANDSQAEVSFGRSVSISSDSSLVAVGRSYDRSRGTATGAVFIFG